VVPPLWERANAGQDERDPQAQPAPDYEFDQRIPWQVPKQDEPPSLVMGVTGSDRVAILAVFQWPSAGLLPIDCVYQARRYYRRCR
jgi:hypothetical protein